jgi:hypothetical protein
MVLILPVVRDLELEFANLNLKSRTGPLTGFVNKVLLEHIYVHSFTYFYGYFHMKTTRLGRCMCSSDFPHCDKVSEKTT